MYDNIIEAINNLKTLMENRTDGINDRLDKVETELLLTRKGFEEWTWGQAVKDSEIDLEDTDG